VSSATEIKFSWTDGVENGGTTVIDYKIMYDQSIDEWTMLVEGVED
jgi:hypothetical protein